MYTHQEKSSISYCFATSCNFSKVKSCTRLTLSGKELDDNIGLYYFGARYYDADLGIFISVDLMREFFDGYSYTGGNPGTLIDPDGMREVPSDFVGPLLQEDWRAGPLPNLDIQAAFNWIDAHPDLVSISESALMGQATFDFLNKTPTAFGTGIHGYMAKGFHKVGFYENNWNRAVNVGISPVYSNGMVRPQWNSYLKKPTNTNYIRIHNADIWAVLPKAEYLATNCFFCYERVERALVGAAYITEKSTGLNGGPMNHHTGN